MLKLFCYITLIIIWLIASILFYMLFNRSYKKRKTAMAFIDMACIIISAFWCILFTVLCINYCCSVIF